LIEDDNYREQMASRASTFAFENYSEKNVDKLIELFDN